MASNGDVGLRIYDLAGRRVRTLVDAQLEAGRYDTTWDGKNDAGVEVASGTYFYRLVSNNETLTGKAILLK